MTVPRHGARGSQPADADLAARAALLRPLALGGAGPEPAGARREPARGPPRGLDVRRREAEPFGWLQSVNRNRMAQ